MFFFVTYKKIFKVLLLFSFLEYHGTITSSLFSELETFCLRKCPCSDRPISETPIVFHNAQFCAFLMKSCKYIWSTSNTTKRKLWPKNSKDSRFKATRLLALREYVVFRVSVPEVFSLWMNQEMTQLGFAGYPKMFMIISNIV